MAVTDVVSLDEFVDLYKILEIPQTASESELRERVNQLYLEAQRNLDHHNFRKRFYYQQLYEIHLPQAHQLLLNAAQRSDYDRYLEAFNKGLPFPDDAATLPSNPTGGDLGRVEGLGTDVLPTVSPEQNLPTASSASSVPNSETSPGRPLSTAPSATPAAARVQPSRTAANSAPATPAAPSIAGASGGTAARPAPVWRPQVVVDASEVERRRDFKRRELIKGELVAAGLTWGWGIGLGVFAVLGALIYLALTQMKMASTPNAVIGSLALVAVVAAVCGRYALREARRRIVVVLSKMPYDELLRRCAK